MADIANDGHGLELAQLKQQRGDITKLLLRLVDAQEQSNELQKQNAEIQKQNNEIQKQNNEPQKQLNEIQKQNNEIQKQNNELQKQLNEIQKQNNEIQQQNRELSKKLVVVPLDQSLNRVSTRPRLDAGARLTETFELLEQILLQLDCEHIFSLQRVNHHFRSTIKSSLPLQRALFLAPAPIDPLQPHKITINPLFEKESIRLRLPFFFDGKSFAYVERARRGRLVARSIAPQSAPVGIKIELLPPCSDQIDFKGIRDASHFGKPVLTTGSWRHMYLSQPPVPVHMSLPFDDYAWADNGWRLPRVRGTPLYTGDVSEGRTFDEILDGMAGRAKVEVVR